MPRLKSASALPAATLSLLAVLALLLAPASWAGHHDQHGSNDDIVAVAVGAGSFETLTAALKGADLVETLQGDGPFTVFAPTDEAFAKLPAGTVENLLLPENRDKLAAILTYHVVPGTVDSKAAARADSATTVQGGDLHFAVDGHGALKVNDAQVVSADVAASNGVIHVIDTVLLPN